MDMKVVLKMQNETLKNTVIKGPKRNVKTILFLYDSATDLSHIF
jgi:hypothetical protein